MTTTRSPLAEEFKRIETALRQGEFADARERVEEIFRGDIRRNDRPMAAQFSGRVGCHDLGLRILAPYVRPPHRSLVEATSEEKAEYAWCLLGVGAVDEAGHLLDKIPGHEYPRALLYQAFFHAATWNYQESIEPLRRYLDLVPKGSYLSLVARTNLAAALVFSRDLYEAEALLRGLLHDTRARKFRLLHANALELSAEMFLLNRRNEDAERCLQEARAALGTGDSVYALLVEKWSVILAYMQGDEKPLLAWREQIAERGWWELARDCDRFRVMKSRDEALAAYLHFGSPSQSYRARLRIEMGRRWTPPESYVWNGGSRGDAPVEVDLFSGEVRRLGKPMAQLRTGHVCHRLMVVLASDFYRPFRTATLFGKLFPDEYFNRDSSPARVHEAMRALRHFFEQNGIPLAAEMKDGAYRLVATGAVAIRLELQELTGKAHAAELDLLRRSFAAAFTSSEALPLAGLPKRSLQRLLNKAVSEGILEKEGVRSSTRYRFKRSA